jgi:hypothetical protein
VGLTIPDVMEWKEFAHWEKSACVDIALNHSQKYYNYVRSYHQALNSRSTNMSSSGGEFGQIRSTFALRLLFHRISES